MINNQNTVVASKYFTTEEIKQIYQKGYYKFGENKAQAFRDKRKELDNLDIEWHFIGNLQRKNIKYVVPCALIHSVNSEKLLEDLQEYCAKNNLSQQVLLQIKLNDEPNQSGFSVDELAKIMQNTKKFDRIIIMGIMVIGPNTHETNKIEAVFAKAEQLKKLYEFKILSMGMSNDYQIALQYGATLIRLGSYFKNIEV